MSTPPQQPCCSQRCTQRATLTRPDAGRVELASDNGFTLIEVFTVMVIVAIIAAIAMPQLMGYRERAWLSAVESDLTNVALYFAAAAADNDGKYPLVIPPGITSSPGVSVTLGTNATTSRICLKGEHAGLTEIRYYDGDNGGLTTVAC